jgi:cell division protein FtsX
MGRSTARWIAIALVGALVAALGVGLVTGRGREADDAARQAPTADGARGADAVDAEVLDGPHVVLELCTGAQCAEPDDADQRALVAEVEQDPRVASVLLVPSDQAYQLFLDRFGDQEELVESVRPEDVPARLEVDLLEPDGAPEVVAEWESHAAVASAFDARSTGR